MAGDSIVGALRVSLGLDSAAFTEGLKQATSGLDKFGKVAGVGLAAAAAAAATLAVGLGVAVKASLDHADALGKLSQRAGTSVEALSRLEYAAKFSDISLESLTGGLEKLGKSMADALTNPTGQASSAFSALGVNIVDSNGKLRDTSSVFTDIATKFAGMEDGATKTSLSMQLLGKSGANLIPILNQGGDDLKRLGDQGEQLGQTFTTKTAASAERLNDSLTLVSEAMGGVINKIAASDGVQQAVQQLADTLSSKNFQDAAETIGTSLAGAVGSVAKALENVNPTLATVGTGILGLGTAATIAAPAIGTLTKATSLLYGQLALIAALPAGVLALATGAYFASTESLAPGEDTLVKNLGLTRLPTPKNTSGSPDDRDPLGGLNVGQLGVAPETYDFGNFFKGLSGSNDNPLDRMAKSTDLLTGKLDGLKKGLSAIGPVTEIIGKGYEDMANTTLGSLDTITSALSQAFQGNKALAAANAAINTAEAVTKALAQGGIWGFASAAAIGAAGAAQVASILSANESSAAVASLGGASASTAASAATQGQAINLTIRGSGNINVDDFAKQLQQSIADGGQSGLIKVIRAA